MMFKNVFFSLPLSFALLNGKKKKQPYQSTAYGHQPPIIQHHSMAQSHYPSIQQQPNKSKNTALKYAAGIGGIGLGAYVLSQAFQSDSDSD